MEKEKRIKIKIQKRQSSKLRAASFSIGVNTVLILIKAVVALFTGSIAIIAELAHSVFDMLASVFAYAGIRKAEQPADATHLYGHEKFENLSSLAQTVLIVITSVVIIFEAVDRIVSPKKPEAVELGLMIMLVTIALDFFISRYLHKASMQYESSALEADAYHFTTDLWSAIAVVVGLAFVIAGFPVFDGIAALAVSLLMLWISGKLGLKAINALIDRSPPVEYMKKIGEVISSTPEVAYFHQLKARQAGNKLLLEVHIHVEPDMTVKKSHEIAHIIEKRLMRKFPNIREVSVHIEPALDKVVQSHGTQMSR